MKPWKSTFLKTLDTVSSISLCVLIGTLVVQGMKKAAIDQYTAYMMGAMAGLGVAVIAAAVTIWLLKRQIDRKEQIQDAKFVFGTRVIFNTLESHDPETIASHGTKGVFMGRYDSYRARVHKADGDVVIIPYDMLVIKENDEKSTAVGHQKDAQE